MKKTIILLFSMLFGGLIYAQQNDEFRSVKQDFDYKRAQIIQSFKTELEKPAAQIRANLLKADFIEFMTKLDSIQNMAYLNALIAVRTREDLAKVAPHEADKSKINFDTPKSNTDDESPAVYPGGINKLRQQLGELFYYDALKSQPIRLATEITFIVEKDGSIAEVRASGNDPIFNRQAEIAVYQLPEIFSPAKIGNTPVRYRFRLPLAMNFE